MSKWLTSQGVLLASAMMLLSTAVAPIAHAENLCVDNAPDGSWDPDAGEQCDSGDTSAPGCTNCAIDQDFYCAASVAFDAIQTDTYDFDDGNTPEGNAQPNWELGYFQATQRHNTYTPTLAYMGADAKARDYEVSMKVHDWDDDFIGFALGYIPGATHDENARYLLIDWKGYTVESPKSNEDYVPDGITLSLVEGIPQVGQLQGQSGTFGNTAKESDFWRKDIPNRPDKDPEDSKVKVLASALNGYGTRPNGWAGPTKKPSGGMPDCGSNPNNSACVSSDTYVFHIHYRSDRLIVKVRNESAGETEEDYHTIFDTTPADLPDYEYAAFPSGQFAFYGVSQANVTYSLEGNFTTECRAIDFEPKDDTFTVDNVSSVTFSASELVSNDGADADVNTLSVSTDGADGPQYGELIDNNDGTYTYIPNDSSHSSPFNDEDSFRYDVCGKDGMAYNWDPAEQCKSATVTITKDVTDPYIEDDNIAVRVDGSNTYFVQNDATRQEGSYAFDFSTTEVTATDQAALDAGAVVTFSNGTISISIPDGYTGPDNFDVSYIVKDNRGNPSNTVTLTVDVIHTPIVSDATFETYAGCDLIDGCVNTYDILDALENNPTYPLAPDTLTLVSDNAPQDVEVVVEDGKIVVNAPADYDETSTFDVEYIVEDNTGNTSNTGTLTVTVKPQEDVSITHFDNDPVTNGVPYTTSTQPPFAGAAHPGTVVGISLDGPSNGSDSVTSDSSGNWTWNPGTLLPGVYELTVHGANGSEDSFAFEVVDGLNVEPDTMQSAQGATGTTTIANLLDNDTNADSSTFRLIDGSATGGTVELDGTDVLFTGDLDATSGSFEYEVCATYDPTFCKRAPVQVTIHPRPEGTASSHWSIVDAPRTVDNPFDSGVITTIDAVDNGGQASIDANGDIIVTPAPNTAGPVIVTVQGCSDTTPAACDTVEIEVLFNDLPVIAHDGATTNVSPGGTQHVSIDASPEDYGEIDWNTLTLADGSADGCSVSQTDKRVSFNAPTSATEGSTHTCQVSLCEKNPTLANDGVEACTEQSYTFGVTDAFFAEEDKLYTHTDTPVDFSADDLLENDNGYDPDSFELNNPGDEPDTWTTDNGGTIHVDDNGNYTYTPPADADIDEDSFSYKVCPAINDGTPCADEVEVVIQIDPQPQAEGITIWVELDTPQVDVALDDLFEAASSIGSVDTPSRVVDDSNTYEASVNACIADDSDCGDAADGNTFLHFVPDTPSEPARYDIPTTLCDDAPQPACAEEVIVSIIYNDAPILDVPDTIVTPGGKKTIDLNDDENPIADPGEQGEIDWGKTVIVDEDGNESTGPVYDGEISCRIEGDQLIFEASENANVGDTGVCTVTICEENPEDLCTTEDFPFTVEDIFDPSEDTLTTIEDTPLPIDLWEDLVRNDGNADYPDNFTLIPDGEEELVTDKGGIVVIDPEDPTQAYYTPAEGFTGEDSFRYTICSALDPDDCEDVPVTVKVLEHVRIDEPSTDTPVDEITGTAEPGSEVTVTIDDKTYDAVPVDENGNWKVPLDEPLAPGEHTVTATTDYDDEDEITVTIEEEDGDDGDDTDDGDDSDDGNGDDGDDGDDDDAETPDPNVALTGGRIGGCASSGSTPSTGLGLLALAAGLAITRRRRR